MPVKIPVVYPRYPRIYPQRPVGRATAARGRGAIAGSTDTTPTGNVGGDIGKAIANIIQQNRQNEFANQLMNQGPTGQPGGGVTQSLGQLPAGGAPQDFTLPASTGGPGPDVGSLVHTGGLGELQMRQQQAQQEAAQRTADLNEQYKRAQLENVLARTRQISAPKTAKPQKPGKYVAGTGDVQNDPSTDDFGQIQTDFDAQHGKGAYAAFTKNISNLVPDGRGNYIVAQRNPDTGEILKDKNGNPVPVMGKDGITPQYSIPATDAPYWMNRYNAARIKGGQDYLGNLPDGLNPNSGVASGSSQINPIPVTTNLQARALPNGTWIQLPDGSTRQITRTASQAQPSAPAGTISEAPSTEEPSTEEPSTEEPEEQG